MTALDIHTVKASTFGKRRRRAEFVNQPIQIIVRKDAVARNGGISLKNGIVISNQRRGCALRLGVAAGMGRLQKYNRFKPVFTHTGFLYIGHKPLIIVEVFFCQPQLARIGTALGRDCSCFRPNQPGPGTRKPVITAQCQFTGTAVRCAVTAFHWLDCNGIRDGFCTDLHGTL